MMIEYNQGLDGSSKGEKASSRPGTKPRARASEAPSAGQVAGGLARPAATPNTDTDRRRQRTD